MTKKYRYLKKIFFTQKSYLSSQKYEFGDPISGEKSYPGTRGLKSTGFRIRITACNLKKTTYVPEHVRVRDIKGGLADAVLDVHVGVVLGQQLAGLALGPVGGRMQRGPPVVILKNLLF
jgi:hypothetical protein